MTFIQMQYILKPKVVLLPKASCVKRASLKMFLNVFQVPLNRRLSFFFPNSRWQLRITCWTVNIIHEEHKHRKHWIENMSIEQQKDVSVSKLILIKELICHQTRLVPTPHPFLLYYYLIHLFSLHACIVDRNENIVCHLLYAKNGNCQSL